MSRRISAGELEARYKTKHELQDFFDEMRTEIFLHFEDKGTSWKFCDLKYLIEQLLLHVKKKDWVSVALFAFMLRDREINRVKAKKELTK